MFLRTVQRRNQDGSVVRYLQLAHNERVPGKAPHAKVLYNFGREDRLDRDEIRRLIKSLSRALEPGEALALQTSSELRFEESRSLGGAYVLDQLWRRLGLHTTLTKLLSGRKLDQRAERAVFAMVANRALEPLSKLACAAWVNEKAAIPGLAGLDDDTCYRSMDWLLEVEPELSEAVYWAVADLLNLEVDLLFFDTTSTYFETDEADEPSDDADKGFRTYNQHSKDHRPDLPQVVIGLAVTREGIPIRVWTWPGNASDQELVRQAKDDLREWKLGRVVWVTDRGMTSEQNRRHLQRAGGHYIMGEKIREGSKDAQRALALPGRYQKVADNLEVKEVVIDDGVMSDRFVICRNPEEVVRDRKVRQNLLKQLESEIKGSDKLPQSKRYELKGQLKSKPGLYRFLRVTKRGLLRVDRARVAVEEGLDGRFLLRTSDPSLSAEDIAVGYKQLLQVERAWRDMKTSLDLRPVHHRLDRRIRSHVVLCWLALLLIRIVEIKTKDTWRNVRKELEKMHLGTFRGPAGVVRQRTQVTKRQADIFAAIGAEAPARFFSLESAPASPAA
jgi:hypothetical protein